MNKIAAIITIYVAHTQLVHPCMLRGGFHATEHVLIKF